MVRRTGERVGDLLKDRFLLAPGALEAGGGVRELERDLLVEKEDTESREWVEFDLRRLLVGLEVLSFTG